jgi:hypothetical protein
VAKERHAVMTTKICIPSYVEKLDIMCFSVCKSLSMVTFESDSQLSSIAESAFMYCSSLSSFFIPSTLPVLGQG